MKEAIELSKQLNEEIRSSAEYQKYIDTKRRLYDNMELRERLREFRHKNAELMNREGTNPFDELNNLLRDYDDLLHNSIVSDFLSAEQKICRRMQEVYNQIAEGLELEF